MIPGKITSNVYEHTYKNTNTQLYEEEPSERLSSNPIYYIRIKM
jgi:hypothetical protein